LFVTGFFFVRSAVVSVFLAQIALDQLVLIALFAVMTNLLWVRGTYILEIDHDRDFSATPIFACLVRTSGEVTALLCVPLGLLGALHLWITGFAPWASQFIQLAGGDPYIGGVLTLILFPVIGLAWLLLTYFLVEMSSALVTIAINTRRTVPPALP
jgi:hypothetical protein